MLVWSRSGGGPLVWWARCGACGVCGGLLRGPGPSVLLRGGTRLPPSRALGLQALTLWPWHGVADRRAALQELLADTKGRLPPETFKALARVLRRLKGRQGDRRHGPAATARAAATARPQQRVPRA